MILFAGNKILTSPHTITTHGMSIDRLVITTEEDPHRISPMEDLECGITIRIPYIRRACQNRGRDASHSRGIS